MTEPSNIHHICVTDVLRVALYLTVTDSACRASFPVETTSLQIELDYLFL